MALTEKEVKAKAEKVAEIISRYGTIKIVNKLVKMGEELSFKGKIYSEVHRIATILSGLDGGDKYQIIKLARKLRSQWRRI